MRAFVAVVVWLRWPILVAWAVAAAYAGFSTPSPSSSGSGVISLVPAGAPAVRVAQRESQLFRIPLQPNSMVVQASRTGLSASAQARSLAFALAEDRRALRKPPAQRFLAIPVPNTFRLAPGARRSGTAIVTYLEYPPSLQAGNVFVASHAYAHALQRASGSVVGVTGLIPAEWHEGTLIQNNLTLVELVTVAVIALLVGIKFRAPGAALLTLATVGIANLSADWALAWVQTSAGVTVPGFLKPLQVALILGIGTDYCVFFLTAFRLHHRRGHPRVAAARAAGAEIVSIVAVGGVILAASLASLEVASLAFFRNLGPGLAITVGVTLVVAVTFVPAALGTFGALLLWPWGGSGREAATSSGDRPGRVAMFVTHRLVALPIVLAVLAGLGVAAWQLTNLSVGFTEVVGLPGTSQERTAYQALSRGFAPGMLAPTTVIVSGSGLGSQAGALSHLESELRRQRGVAAVIGPADQPFDARVGLIYGHHGTAARYLVILNTDPFGSAGIRDLARLRSGLPGLVGRSGLHSVAVGVTGDTAIAQETTAQMRGDAVRVAPLLLAVNVILLGLFLRALLAPVMLVAASVLSVGATLGITTWVFSDLLGYGELTYYVPYATAVLLISLASDYNIFVTGRIWQELRKRPIRQAIAIAGPRTADAVRTAGFTLAASFAAIALIPVRGFREFAFAMTVGIALETFAVRPVLVPAMISLAGYASGWPGKGLLSGRRRWRRQRQQPAQPQPPHQEAGAASDQALDHPAG